MRENLEKQCNQTQDEIKNTREERKERRADLKQQRKNVKNIAGAFYSLDKKGGFVARQDFKDLEGPASKKGYEITKKKLVKYTKGKNKGKYKKDKNGAYIYEESTDYAKLDTSSADAFLTDLTAKNKYGKAKFTEQQQREILDQAGLSDEIAEFANIDWENSTEEERNKAAREYLEYLKEVPEEYNKAKDAINENIEKQEELKNKLLEYNNQIRESLKQHDGVTEKLEVGYNWIRKITTEQTKLNILTQRYNNLQKKRDSGLGAVSDRELANNLIQRGKIIENEQKDNTELRSEKYGELVKARNELMSNSYNKKFFTLDKDKNVVYSNKLISLKDKNIKVDEISRDKKGREIHVDKNGNEIYYGKKGYQEAEVKHEEKEYKLSDIFKLDTNGKISPENFINTLMGKDVSGNPILSLEKQIASVKAIMGNNFEKDVLPKFGDFENWNEANETQQKEAWTKYLESLPSSVEYVNNLKDGVKNLDTEVEKLKGDHIELNAELKELAETAAGLENPFEKWYNWTQKIKKEQNQLNLLTEEYGILQNDNIANGDEIARNLKQQLVNLEYQQKTTRGYLAEQKEEKNTLLNRLNNNAAMSRLFSYSEETGLQFNNNIDFSKFKESLEQGIDIKNSNINPEEETLEVKTHIFSAEDFKNITSMTDFFEELGKRDEITGKSKYNVEEQFAVALEAGLQDLMQYDESGNEIFINGIENATKEQAEKAVKALFSNTQEFMEAFNEVEDGIQNNLEKDYDIQNKINEIYNQLKDNEIDLENTIMASLESLKQKEIDNVQDIRDDLSTASGKLLKGLNDSLNKEKNLYAKNENQQSIDQLQQKIALLQRSGGSGSEIQSLQKDLASKQKEMYFDERQEQINAIQEASDLELEKLEQQISIMTETLEYQKENGLLWNDVYEVMRGTPEQIAAFISENDAKYKALSNLQFEDAYTDILQNAQIYKSAIDEIIANQNSNFPPEGEVDEKQFKTQLLNDVSEITFALTNKEKETDKTSLETISERLNQILGNGDENGANLKTIEATITDSNNNTISKIIGDGEKTNLGSIEESFLEKIDEIKTELTNEIDIFTKTIATL